MIECNKPSVTRDYLLFHTERKLMWESLLRMSA